MSLEAATVQFNFYLKDSISVIYFNSFMQSSWDSDRR